jgi:hypothetical protein
MKRSPCREIAITWRSELVSSVPSTSVMWDACPFAVAADNAVRQMDKNAMLSFTQRGHNSLFVTIPRPKLVPEIDILRTDPIFVIC